MPYVAKRKRRKYYKYTYENWSQPVFSSNNNTTNNIVYTLSASHQSQPAWYAFNNNKTTGDNCWWTAHGVTSSSNPCWICMKSSVKLKMNKLVIRNEHVSPENFKTGYLQVSNDGINFKNIANITGTNTGGFETTVNINVSEPYYYYRLYFTESYSSGGVSIQTLEYSGQKAISINGTSSDYNYYVDEIESYMPKYNKPYYWKVDDTPVTVFESSTPQTKQFNLPTGTLKITMVGGGSSGSTHGNSASGGSGAMVQFTIDNDVERLVSLTIPSGGKVMYQGKHASGGSPGGDAVFSMANKLTVTCKGASASNSDQYIWDEGIKKTHGGVGGDGYTKDLLDSSLNFVEVAMLKGKTGGDTEIQPNVPGESVYPPYGAGGNAGNPNTTEACRGGDGYIKIERLVYYTPATPDDYDTITYEMQQLFANRKRRKYYKYAYESWSQPILTSNESDSSFIVSASSQYSTSFAPWKSFSSNTNSTESWMTSVTPSESSPQWYKIKTDFKLKIKNILMKNRSNGDAIIDFVIQGSDDDTHWENITSRLSNNVTGGNQTWNIEVNASKGYYYTRFLIYKSSNNSRTPLGFPTITATKGVPKLSTINDYDFYKDEYI